MDTNLENEATGPTETIVGPSVKIQGDLNSEGDIKIEGQVAGTVTTSQNVYVGDKAIITADVVAGSAIIAGNVNGNLKINNHLILQSTATISGDIACEVLRVEDGAHFTGKCNMGGNSKSKAKEREPETEE